MSVDYSLIEAAVREAGQLLLEADAARAEIYKKEGPANFATAYDLKIQDFLIGRFKEILPSASYYGEEDTSGNAGTVADRGCTFIIDPIDGTTNFMFGYKHSCVSVGLSLDGRIIAGFVYNPYTNEFYKATRGEGSFLNGRRLTAANRPLAEGIAAFGCARYNDSDADRQFAIVKELFKRSLAVRNGGSAALDLCRIASNANVLYYESRLQPYDYAAASVIIEEAGGVITQCDGSKINLNGPCSILAGTKKAWEEGKSILNTEIL